MNPSVEKTTPLKESPPYQAPGYGAPPPAPHYQGQGYGAPSQAPPTSQHQVNVPYQNGPPQTTPTPNGFVPPPQPSNIPPPTPANIGSMIIATATVPPYTTSMSKSYQSAAARLGLLPRKSVLEAYLLAVSPLGVLGAHHFYLRRYYWGVVYFFTMGLMGCGYLIDWFRVPCLVKEANEKIRSMDQAVKEKKTLSDAYTLWFPFGLLGFHHYYLGNYAWGAVYTFSFGLFGIGWLVDCVRMYWLVRDANERIMSDPLEKNEKNLCPAYALGLTPIGFLGGHHYYLNRPIWGVLYSLTGGLVGVGWVYDWFRMPCLVQRANDEVRGKRPHNTKTSDDAYILWFVFGFLGAHHFYLGRHLWGLLYFFTLGLLGLGWLVDMCRIPFLVKQVNRENEEKQRIIASQIEDTNRQIIARVIGPDQGYANYGMVVNPGQFSPTVPQMPQGQYGNYPVGYGYGPGAPGYQAGYMGPGQPPSNIMMGEAVQPPPYSPREPEAGPLPDKHMV